MNGVYQVNEPRILNEPTEVYRLLIELKRQLDSGEIEPEEYAEAKKLALWR